MTRAASTNVAATLTELATPRSLLADRRLLTVRGRGHHAHPVYGAAPAKFGALVVPLALLGVDASSVTLVWSSNAALFERAQRRGLTTRIAHHTLRAVAGAQAFQSTALRRGTVVVGAGDTAPAARERTRPVGLAVVGSSATGLAARAATAAAYERTPATARARLATSTFGVAACLAARGRGGAVSLEQATLGGFALCVARGACRCLRGRCRGCFGRLLVSGVPTVLVGNVLDLGRGSNVLGSIVRRAGTRGRALRSARKH